MFLIFYSALLYNIIPSISGHGRLIEPPSRASAWRYGFNTPHNYNDHELYCGGFTRQWVKNEGKCGVCGDAWDTKTPRPHEFGGTYGQGLIVRKYGVGSVFNIRVELTANHNGYFEFSVCPDYKTTTQKCLDKNVLKLVKVQEDVEHQNTRYFPKEGNKVYEMKYRLPKQTCEHCVLQWRYIAGNNWGNCPNGTGAVGCGPQEEFRACSDIKISGRGTDQEMEPDIPETPIEPTQDSTTAAAIPGDQPEPSESYNPISALIVTLVSFLVVCLILFLLYFHFYRVGNKVKSWIKSQGSEKNASSNIDENLKSVTLPPLPPPRVKRRNSFNESGGMTEVNLNMDEDSLA